MFALVSSDATCFFTTSCLFWQTLLCFDASKLPFGIETNGFNFVLELVWVAKDERLLLPLLMDPSDFKTSDVRNLFNGALFFSPAIW